MTSVLKSEGEVGLSTRLFTALHAAMTLAKGILACIWCVEDLQNLCFPLQLTPLLAAQS